MQTSRESCFQFVVLLCGLGRAKHLIVLCFADPFFEKLRTLAPPFAILVFAKRLRHVAPGELDTYENKGGNQFGEGAD